MAPIAAMIDPPPTPKVVRRWFKNAGVPTRDLTDHNRHLAAQGHSATNAEKARAELERLRREEGLVTSHAEAMHTPEAVARQRAAIKARAKSRRRAKLPDGYISVPDALKLTGYKSRDSFVQQMKRKGVYLALSPRKGAIHLAKLQEYMAYIARRKERPSRLKAKIGSPVGYMTVLEAAERLGISNKAVYQRIAARPQSALRKGRRVWVNYEAIAALLPKPPRVLWHVQRRQERLLQRAIEIVSQLPQQHLQSLQAAVRQRLESEQ